MFRFANKSPYKFPAYVLSVPLYTLGLGDYFDIGINRDVFRSIMMLIHTINNCDVLTPQVNFY